MILPPPLKISARLMAGLQFKDNSWISLEIAQKVRDRVFYRYFIDTPDGKQIETGEQLSVRARNSQEATLTDATETLTAFLMDPDGGEWFSAETVKWAKAHYDELEEFNASLGGPKI